MKNRIKLLTLKIKVISIKMQIFIDDVNRFFRQLRCKHELAKMTAKSHWKCNREHKIKVVCSLCDKKFYKKGNELTHYQSIKERV